MPHNNRYRIVYADPPWTYRDKAHAGKRGVEYKYSCLTVAQLKCLPVYRIAAEDCALFLWTTGPMMPDAIEVMHAWGFIYKTVAFTWIKRTKRDKLFWGMGNWTRANAEYVLLGICGKPKRLSAGVHSIVEAPVGGHSEKPAEVRRRIVELMGDVPRIELFATSRFAGWAVWGDAPTVRNAPNGMSRVAILDRIAKGVSWRDRM